MPDEREQEISQPDVTEIPHEDIPEFEQSTEHPQGDDTRMQSGAANFANEDFLYWNQ
jgi:hypothetical protein